MEHGPRYRYALEKGMSAVQHSDTRGDQFVSVVMPSQQNRMRITSMRASETQEQALERLEQNRTHVASMRASEVKLGPEFVCTCCHRMMYRKSVVACNCQLILIDVQSST